MKTLLSIVCLIVALSFSTAFAQVKDFGGCEEIDWKQHISKVLFKMKKVDSDKLVDGTKMDVYIKDKDPSLEKHKESLHNITYLFINDRFAATMYTAKNVGTLLGLMDIISKKIGGPDKITIDEQDVLQAVWVRPKTIAYLDSKDGSILVGDIDAMILIMDKLKGASI